MGNALVIVESPTKAKTITRFLGKGYTVVSSYGHFRDLPKSKFGVDVKNDFTPEYVIPKDSKSLVTDLQKKADKAEIIYLATDQDREGEAIAWHLATVLEDPKKELKRIAFHEITDHAIKEAIKDPHELNMDLVNAQQARRILDRIVGYELSPFLWKKVARGISAGRVQSVAVRLIVEREREIEAFKPKEYWTVDALFTKDSDELAASLAKKDGKTLGKFGIPDEKTKQEIEKELEGAAYSIASITEKKVKRSPYPPYTTSTLQQDANRKLGFSSKKTMVLAQKLYEGLDIPGEGQTGLITYMRTDSLTLSQKFLGEAKAHIAKSFGEHYAHQAPRFYKTKSKGAQEAHEAIRPTDPARTPQVVAQAMEHDMQRLYELIWNRAMASQMADAELNQTGIDINAGATGYTFRANGTTVIFDGFLKLSPNKPSEQLLPQLKEKDALDLKKLTSEQHFTEPPARYSEAGLVKVLEEHGIGRPSTYAPTISTIVDRGYVEMNEQKRLQPTDLGTLVTDLLVEHFKHIVDYAFTAEVEQHLDEIAEGTLEWPKMLKNFYGPFHKNLEEKTESLSRDDVMKVRIVGKDPKTGLDIIARHGRFGVFVQLGEWSEEDKKAKKNKPRSASLPKGATVDSIDVEGAMKLLVFPKVLGTDEDGEEINVNVGRYGPYLNKGRVNAKLPDGVEPNAVTFEQAKDILVKAKKRKEELAKPIAELGEDPQSKQPILVKNGRFGPYITDGKTNVSVKKDMDPASVTHEKAVEMLEYKRKNPGRGRFRRKKKA
ncbi:MAG: type I DNA topoisomerase [Patescibacteria group bacterium]|jgi:DNA topoisomerase-1